MRELIMAKNWTVIRTDRVSAPTKVESVKKAKTAAKVIGCTKSKSYEDLKKEGNDAHATASEKEEAILTAYHEGKLRSENLKKIAEGIEKKKAAAKAKNEKKGKAKGKAD